MRNWAASHGHRRADWDATYRTFLGKAAENLVPRLVTKTPEQLEREKMQKWV
jgi:hypothetical protein